MILEILNPITDIRWLKFISAHPKSNIFHHPKWHSVLKNQYNFSTFIVACVSANDEIIAGIPFCEIKSLSGKTNWISLPFSDHCQPLFMSSDSITEIEEYLVKNYNEGRINSIEIRGEIPTSNSFLKSEDYFIHSTPLKNNAEDLFFTFKKTQIQQPIKKAERDGVNYLISTDFKQLEEFYSLHLKTRKKLGVPIQPKNFFKEIYNCLIQPGFGFTVITYMDSKPIGAGLFLGFKDILTYKFSASDPLKLNLRPNHLMLWAAFQEGIKRGFKYFDFGRTEIENEGLRKYKAGWGSIENPLIYSYYPHLPVKSKVSIIKDNFVAPLIKNSPEFVCRTIGEIAYKYFPSL
jgi:lipid II:glycine glycyltransferase (peptidoglycan interpeptide bridge formation enzyme)